MLRVDDLIKLYRVSNSQQTIIALDGVSLEIDEGEALGLVGGSGAGKSTLAHCVLGLERPTSGQIYFKDLEISNLKPRELRHLREQIQIIWQDPYVYLNPYLRVEELVREPLENYRKRGKREMGKRVRELLDQVGLDHSLKGKYPHELSGGQCQRVAIARALALNPDFLICDEPLSALDAPLQIHILDLLKELQREMGLTYLFITHDLSVVRHLCSRIAVIYKGKIVEHGTTEEIFCRPLHPHTRLLISSMLNIDMV